MDIYKDGIMFLCRNLLCKNFGGIMGYLTTSEIAEKWGVSRRRVTTLCRNGRLEGAILKGKTWLVPEDAIKPVDLRKKDEDK